MEGKKRYSDEELEEFGFLFTHRFFFFMSKY